MSDQPFYAPNRTTAPRQARVGERLWVIQKNGRQLTCELRDEAAQASKWWSLGTGNRFTADAGRTVRWQWMAVANANRASIAWNFSGTLTADNTITGFAEQNGRSLPFTATKQ